MGVLFEAKEEQERAGLLEDFIQKAGGCAVIDGGFATQLEIHGASINDPLWSALCLINSPHLITKVSSTLRCSRFSCKNQSFKCKWGFE